MLRAFGKLSLGLALTLSLAAACGSDDGKKQAKHDGEAAGQGGQEDIGAGGGKNHAGEPGALPGGAGGELPVVIVGGAGGESPVGVSGGAGGESPVQTSGGAGGEGPDIACCQPKSCEELGFCDYLLPDGCGHNVVCGCDPGFSCQSYHCAECVPQDPQEFCSTHCGQTVDNCNNPIKCKDLCGELDPGSFCVEGGTCCKPQTECTNQCGVIGDGCGGTLDCGDNCEGSLVCGNNNACCMPDAEGCLGKECGTINDGCIDHECGSSCESGQACVDNQCQPSECQAQGFECGSILNGAAGLPENCGSCAPNEGCIDNHCVATCGAAR